MASKPSTPWLRVFVVLFIIGMSCNILAVAVHLYETNANWKLWANLAGCVAFWPFVSEALDA